VVQVRRNGPCPCGSGIKAKRCCLEGRELLGSPPRFLPAALCHEAARVLAGVGADEFEVLFSQMLDLPEIDSSLQVPLPELFMPEVFEILCLLDFDDSDAWADELDELAFAVDSPELRVLLAQAVVALRDRGRISSTLAAVAIEDLDGDRSALFWCSLFESITVFDAGGGGATEAV
jgi:SEC-C motif